MNFDELVAKYNGEFAAGRIVVTHNGSKEYITDLDADGVPFLNALGLLLEAGPGFLVEPTPVAEVAAEPVVEEAPKKRKVQSETVAEDDVQIEI